MGKNRVQRKQKEKDKPNKDNIYSKKHVRITLIKQENKLNLSNKNQKNSLQ